MSNVSLKDSPHNHQRIRPIALAAILFGSTILVIFLGSAVLLLDKLSIGQALTNASMIAIEKSVGAFICAVLTFFLDSRRFKVSTTAVIYIVLFVGLQLLMQTSLRSTIFSPVTNAAQESSPGQCEYSASFPTNPTIEDVHVEGYLHVVVPT